MSAVIGSRWRPGHRVFRDDETGTYSEVNSPMRSATELLVQRALLAPKRRSFEFPITWLVEVQLAER
jgi:hypothetical protein